MENHSFTWQTRQHHRHLLSGSDKTVNNLKQSRSMNPNLFRKCIFKSQTCKHTPTHSRLWHPVQASVFPVLMKTEERRTLVLLKLPILTETALIVSLVPQAQIANKQAFLSTRIERRGQCQDTWSDPLHTHTQKQEMSEEPPFGPLWDQAVEMAKEHHRANPLRALQITVHYVQFAIKQKMCLNLSPTMPLILLIGAQCSPRNCQYVIQVARSAFKSNPGFF